MRALKLDRHANVLRFGAQPSQSESKCIRTEFVDDVEWVDSIPLALGHRLAVAVENLRVNEDFLEGNFAHVVEPHQNHSRNPQRDNVARGDERAGGIEVVQFRRLFRPSERGMGPQGRREPSVEHVCLPNKSQGLQFCFKPSVFATNADVHGGRFLDRDVDYACDPLWHRFDFELKRLSFGRRIERFDSKLEFDAPTKVGDPRASLAFRRANRDSRWRSVAGIF